MDPSTGKETDDKSLPGQSCSDARKSSENNRPSATAYGGPMAAQQEVADAVGAFFGKGPKNIYYGPDDPFTIAFKKSAGMIAIMTGVKKNCSVTTGGLSVGTGEAFVNTMIDALVGGAGLDSPEAQIGAFNATYSRSNGRVDITVTNPISLNSLLLHVPAKVGVGNPAQGSFGTVNQTLEMAASDPCN